MSARSLLVWGFGIAAVVAVACGGSSSGGSQSDGASSSSGGSSGGSSSGTNGGQCTGSTPPQIECDICGSMSSETAQCIDGIWMCPNLPVHCVGLDDASAGDGSASGDGGAKDGASSDAGFACTSCDPQSHFCERSYGPPPNDGGSGVPTDSCELFSACDSGTSCDCASIGPFCTCADVAGAVTVTCPFHP